MTRTQRVMRAWFLRRRFRFIPTKLVLRVLIEEHAKWLFPVETPFIPRRDGKVSQVFEWTLQ